MRETPAKISRLAVLKLMHAFNFNCLQQPRRRFERGRKIFHVYLYRLLLLVITMNTVSGFSQVENQATYNGIALPAEWPPKAADAFDRKVKDAPYLANPPLVIPIDVGRQLFVDDFLVKETTLKRVYHAAHIHKASPILAPETRIECGPNWGGPQACPFDGGVCFDSKDQLFKLWYHAGWKGIALATSRDGINWERPSLDVVPGTNLVISPKSTMVDGCTVWFDNEAKDSQQRFKMFLYIRPNPDSSGIIYSSPDGIHWTEISKTAPCGDNSNFYYDPFHQKYVMSLRGHTPTRIRLYYASATFEKMAQWPADTESLWWIGGPKSRITENEVAHWPVNELVPWLCADEGDKPEPKYSESIGMKPMLYDFNAVAYESVMLGSFGIFYGPENNVAKATNQAKIIDLHLGFSRDGFHWQRPAERTPFLTCTRNPGDWNYAYLHMANGICCVVGDELRFYFGAFSGLFSAGNSSANAGQNQKNRSYAGGNTGMAVLRRDGFASMDADASGGTLTTRKLTFNGKYCFVNVDAPQGELRVEVLDGNDHVIAPFTKENCVPVKADKTKQLITWNGAADLSALSGRPVQFRFHLENGKLYAFWVSPDTNGASHGFVAAGGPGFNGSSDTTGGEISDTHSK
jgi:hypothetical protein